jgi:hypothetical protein
MNNIVNKVQKLIALSASSNENEAHNAAAKACQLIREHKLRILPDQCAPTPEPVHAPPPPKREPTSSQWRPKAQSYGQAVPPPEPSTNYVSREYSDSFQDFADSIMADYLGVRAKINLDDIKRDATPPNRSTRDDRMYDRWAQSDKPRDCAKCPAPIPANEWHRSAAPLFHGQVHVTCGDFTEKEPRSKL